MDFMVFSGTAVSAVSVHKPSALASSTQHPLPVTATVDETLVFPGSWYNTCLTAPQQMERVLFLALVSNLSAI